MQAILATNEYYHVYNRGVLKQPIFYNTRDYRRFVDNLRDFNDTRPVSPRKPNGHRMSAGRSRVPIVSVLAWCLMPNHYHLLLQQERDGGITKFMRKVGDGYAKYVNKRYERSGHLFQSKYQSKLIETTEYFLQVSRYIHLNPAELVGHQMSDEQLKYATCYRWSSLRAWMNPADPNGVLNVAPISAFAKSIDYPAFLKEGLQTSDVQLLDT